MKLAQAVQMLSEVANGQMAPFDRSGGCFFRGIGSYLMARQ